MEIPNGTPIAILCFRRHEPLIFKNRSQNSNKKTVIFSISSPPTGDLPGSGFLTAARSRQPWTVF